MTPLFTRCCTQSGDPLAAGWMTFGRKAQRHGGLDLQQAVEHPDAAEADAKDASGQWFREGAGEGVGKLSQAVLPEAPVLDGPHDIEGHGTQHDDQEDDEKLMKEGGAKAG